MENLNKFQRYSLKKNPQFNINKIKSYINNFSEEKFEFVRIDPNIADRIRKDEFMLITDNYKENGIGYCCLYNNEIIGAATSNIFYSDGIEINIKVKEECLLKDYIINYSGFTITYKIGRGPTSCCQTKSELIPYHKFNEFTQRINDDPEIYLYWIDKTKEVNFLPSLVSNKRQIEFRK